MEPSRLKVGVDVPWVTSWSEEPVLGAARCPSAEGALAVVQEDHAGYGRPIYSANHFSRQRLSVRQMLCPMCGQATEPKDRWTLTGKLVTLGELRARGLGEALPKDLPDRRVVLDGGAVAPLHLACAKRSLLYCPHLRSDPEVKLRRFPKQWVAFPLFAEITPPPAPGNETAAPDLPPIVSFVQICGLNPQ